MNLSTFKLIECPRDAMQGWKSFIPTEKKIEYINSLLKVGFDTIDFGSFVSPKAIPQMADTREIVGSLESEVGSRESGVGSLESGVGSLESGVGSLESGVGSLESGVGS